MKKLLLVVTLLLLSTVVLSGCVLRTNEVSKFCKANDDFDFDSHGDCVSTIMEYAVTPPPNTGPVELCKLLDDIGALDALDLNLGECVSQLRP